MSHFLEWILGCALYHFFVMVKFKLLAQFLVDHLAHLVLYSVCTNLLHSHIM